MSRPTAISKNCEPPLPGRPIGYGMRNLALKNLLKRRVLVALVLGTAILGGTVVYAQAGKVTTS